MVSHRFAVRRAFTPIQLIVVLAILLMFLALLAPAVARVRDAAARAQSMNNLKQLALAMHNAHDVYSKLPPTVGEFAGKTGTAHLFILPFVEQQNIFNGATNAVWDNDTWSKRIGVYLDPRDTTAPPENTYMDWLATTNYPVNWMVFGDGPRTRSLIQITDGTSNTLMFAQRYQMCDGTPTAWGYPTLYKWAPMIAYDNQLLFQISPAPSECDPTRAQSIGSVMLIAMCDGSCRTVSNRLSATTWAFLCDPTDGNPLGADFN